MTSACSTSWATQWSTALLPIPGPFEELAGGLAIVLRLRPGLVASTWSEIRAARGTGEAPAA